jgi:hypothetical protein
MTTQDAKLLERGGCVVYYFNREGRDFFTPRFLSQSRRPEAGLNSATTISHCEERSDEAISAELLRPGIATPQQMGARNDIRGFSLMLHDPRDRNSMRGHAQDYKRSWPMSPG